MSGEYKPKSWYIKLIHIAKTQLKMDDTLYRSSLKSLTGKASCKDMSLPDLVKVLEYMKNSGFKPKAKISKKKSPKTREKLEGAHTMLDKLRQLWIEMHKQGFIQDGSEPALEKWAINQSKSLNNGQPVNKLEWLPGNMLHAVIEQLKQWHMRLLKPVFPPLYKEMILLNQESRLTKSQQDDFIYHADRLSRASETHDVVSNAYKSFVAILAQHNEQVRNK
ncbi:regulatory protein GemA [Thalassomonas viridans]|uniref:Regulatory protein GemA n=1 Tax=Thalassomonas viridans TaxID=137584 RepID=A0AAE9Z5X2_9GAMM|nr:regulatory protein GemA [Thalassomonas viridans]WDE07255.1 regulatory protein GemA [Thalassomonas viridans]